MNEACDITVAFEDVGEGEEGEEELDDDSHKECATPSNGLFYLETPLLGVSP